MFALLYLLMYKGHFLYLENSVEFCDVKQELHYALHSSCVDIPLLIGVKVKDACGPFAYHTEVLQQVGWYTRRQYCFQYGWEYVWIEGLLWNFGHSSGVHL